MYRPLSLFTLNVVAMVSYHLIVSGLLVHPFFLQGSITCIITFCALMDTLFEICCKCAELNLEPIEGEEEEEHNWIFSAAQLEDDEVAEGEDPDWNLSQNLTTTIGHTNGDYDLACTVLEVS